MSRAEFRHHFKPMAPVECNIPFGLCLEVCSHPRRIEPPRCRSQQAGANTETLRLRAHAEEPQVGMLAAFGVMSTDRGLKREQPRYTRPPSSADHGWCDLDFLEDRDRRYRVCWQPYGRGAAARRPINARDAGCDMMYQGAEESSPARIPMAIRPKQPIKHYIVLERSRQIINHALQITPLRLRWLVRLPTQQFGIDHRVPEGVSATGDIFLTRGLKEPGRGSVITLSLTGKTLEECVMRIGPNIDAALSGFRLVREHPWTIVIWTALCFAYSAAQGIFASATAGSGVMRFLALANQANPNPDQIVTTVVGIAPTYLVLVAVNMAFYAVFFAAANRAAVSPGQDQFGYLALGARELRQFGLITLLFGATFTIYLALAIAASLVGAAVAMLAGAAVGVAVAATLVVLGLGYLWMRFSLASPLTFATDRIDLLGSWALTRESQWMILRTYLLALILTVAVYIVGMTLIITLMAAAVGGFQNLLTIASPDLSSVSQFVSPPRMILLAMQAVLSALILPVAVCPAIEIYRELQPVASVAPKELRSEGSPWS